MSLFVLNPPFAESFVNQVVVVEGSFQTGEDFMDEASNSLQAEKEVSPKFFL